MSLSFLVIGVGLVLSYFLSGIESAILSVSQARLRHAAEEGDKICRYLESAFENRQHLLVAILVTNSAINLLIFAAFTRLLVNQIGIWGYLVGFLVSLPIVVLWVEILPKAHFRRAPLKLLRHCFLLTLLVDWTIRPIVSLFAFVFSRFFRSVVEKEPPSDNREAFQNLTNLFERDGVLNHDETSIIRNVLSFHRGKVQDVMRPLEQTTCIPPSLTVAEILELSANTGYDQFPIQVPGGKITGIVDITSIFLREPSQDETASRLRAEIVPTTPEEGAINVVKQLRRAGLRLAVVNDTSGSPIGVVSIEDLTRKMVQLDS